MIEPLGAHNIHEFLSAFADGELDAAQNLAVLDYLETHPSAFAYLRDRQRLRQSAQRIVLADQQANTMPAQLKERLNRLADIEPPAAPPPPQHAARRWWPRGLGIIAASVLVVLLASRPWRSAPPRGTEGSAPIAHRAATAQEVDLADSAIPISLISSATHVHINCSRLADRLHAGGYPRDLGPLSEWIREDLATPSDVPDLSAAGFHFVGAGPCPKPPDGTAHLLYRKDGSEPRAAVSVFAQPYRGQFNLQIGRLYCVASGEATFPMCAWRTERVVYFLIADDVRSNVAARRAISFAPSRTLARID